MQLKFARHDIRGVRRVSAVDGQSVDIPQSWSNTCGAYGCLLSHLQVVREARAVGAPSVLIFEDDAAFAERLPENFSNYIKQLPGDWDMLHFGVMHLEEPLRVSENVQRVRRAYSTFTYALRDTIFDTFIELNSKAQTPVDVNNLVLQSERRVYCFTPHLSWVENDGSDVQEREKDHWYLRESLVILGSTMDQLMSQTTLVIAHHNPSRRESITANLIFLAACYRERLPGMSVLIVEQDTAPTLNPLDLPSGCQYFLLRETGPFNRGLCFNTGVTIANPDHSFLIFADNDIFLEEWDIRGQLRICQRYDGTTGAKRIVELTRAATDRLRSNQASLLTPWFNAKEYSRTEKRDQFGQFSVFNRRGFAAAGGWVEQPAAEDDPPLSLRRPDRLHIFPAPNDALRLLRD